MVYNNSPLPGPGRGEAFSKWLDSHASVAVFTLILSLATAALAWETYELVSAERSHSAEEAKRQSEAKENQFNLIAYSAGVRLYDDVNRFPAARACNRFIVARDIAAGVPAEQAGIDSHNAHLVLDGIDPKAGSVSHGNHGLMQFSGSQIDQAKFGRDLTDLSTTSLLTAVLEDAAFRPNASDALGATSGAEACLAAMGSTVLDDAAVAKMRFQVIGMFNAIQLAEITLQDSNLPKEAKHTLRENIYGTLNQDQRRFITAVMVYLAAKSKGGSITFDELSHEIAEFDDCDKKADSQNEDVDLCASGHADVHQQNLAPFLAINHR